MRCQSLLLAVFLLFSSALWADAAKEEKLAQFKSFYADYESFYSENNWDKAAERAYETLKLGRELFSPTGKNVAALQYNYGFALKQARIRRGSDELAKAVALYEGSYGQNSAELIPVLIDYGHSYTTWDSDKVGKFYKAAKRIVSLSERYHEELSPEHGRNLVEAGSIFTKLGNSPRARRYLEKGQKILSETLGDKSLHTAYGSFQLAKWAMARKKYEKAVSYFEAALPAFELEGSSTDLELMTRAQLVHAYEKLEQSELATAHCLAIGKKSPFVSADRIKPIFRVEPQPTRGVKWQDGYVILHHDVDSSGIVRNITVGEGNLRTPFVDAAVEALEQFRYAPPHQNGRHLEVKGIRHKFTFSVD